MVASEEELWKPVIGFETAYEVSNWGRVRTLPRSYIGRHNAVRQITPRVIAQYVNTTGYLIASMCIENKIAQRVAHRLVAEAFIGMPPSPKHQINHIDGNKRNNRIENLEWVTPAENIQHAYRTGLHVPPIGENSSNAKLTEDKVREIRAMIAAGVPQRQVESRYGISRGQASRIANRKLWKHVD